MHFLVIKVDSIKKKDSNDSGSKIITALILSFSGGLIILASTVMNLIIIIQNLGFTSIFEKISLSSELKVSIPLYATTSSLSILLMIIAALLLRKGYSKTACFPCALSVIFGLLSAIVPVLMKLPVEHIYLYISSIGAILMGVAGIISARIPQERRIKYMTPLEISLTAIFSAITAVVTGVVGSAFPSPTGGYTHIGDAIIFIASLLFGVKIGFLVGAIGPTVADLAVGYPRWFVTVVAHGVEGLIAGFGKKRNIVIQAILCAVGGFFMTLTYFYVNIFIKGYPVAIISFYRDLFGQVGLSLIITMILIKPIEKTVGKMMKM